MPFAVNDEDLRKSATTTQGRKVHQGDQPRVHGHHPQPCTGARCAEEDLGEPHASARLSECVGISQASHCDQVAEQIHASMTGKKCSPAAAALAGRGLEQTPLELILITATSLFSCMVLDSSGISADMKHGRICVMT